MERRHPNGKGYGPGNGPMSIRAAIHPMTKRSIYTGSDSEEYFVRSQVERTKDRALLSKSHQTRQCLRAGEMDQGGADDFKKDAEKSLVDESP